jgi:hypothetical protein
VSISADIGSRIEEARPRLLRYLETGNLLEIEKERISFLLDPDPERETLSDHGSATSLVQHFEQYGHLGIFEAGAAREEDFRKNQGQGEWAEKLLAHAEWPSYKLVPFGPSDGIIPKEAGYEEKRLRYREFTAVEGKRPDLLVFPERVEAEHRDRIASWRAHPIMQSDIEVFNQCVCGIEVKSSLWHYGQRRRCGGRGLSITVKTEEWNDIAFWVEKFRKPLFFVQAFVDEMYVASYAGLEDRKHAQRGYSEKADPETRKPTSWFSLSESEPQIAEILTDFSAFTRDDRGQITRPQQWPSAALRLLMGIPELLAL